MERLLHRSFPFSTQVGHLSPSSAILVPTSCQEVPNLTPRSSKRAQNPPQEPPTRPPKIPKCSQNAVLSFDFRLSLFFQMSLPRPPKMLKIAPQMASRWPSWRQLGSSWRHLGPNFGVLAHLGEILVDPSPAKIDPRQLQRSIFLEFGRILGSILDDFLKIFGHILILLG